MDISRLFFQAKLRSLDVYEALERDLYTFSSFFILIHSDVLQASYEDINY